MTGSPTYDSYRSDEMVDPTTTYLRETFGAEQFVNEQIAWNVLAPNGEGEVVGQLTTFNERSTDGRSKLWIAPLFVPGPNELRPIFSRVMYVMDDPSNVKPDRPVGHIHAEHTNPTSRWEDKELSASLLSLVNAEWKQFKDDGGSVYYQFIDSNGITYIQQVAKESGRVLIGIVEVHTLLLENESSSDPQPLKFKIVKRVVVNEGNKRGRSPVGSTNYDFMGFSV